MPAPIKAADVGLRCDNNDKRRETIIRVCLQQGSFDYTAEGLVRDSIASWPDCCVSSVAYSSPPHTYTLDSRDTTACLRFTSYSLTLQNIDPFSLLQIIYGSSYTKP